MLGIKSVDSIECYACGLAMIDPIEDKQTYNMDPDDPGGKMYNETCIVFDTFLLEHPKIMSKWLRTCPKNVRGEFIPYLMSLPQHLPNPSLTNSMLFHGNNTVSSS